MTKESIKEQIADWFSLNLSVYDYNDGSMSIDIPVVDAMNDDIRIYIESYANGYKLSDGQAVSDALRWSGFDLLDREKVHAFINPAFKRYGVEFDENTYEAFIISTEEFLGFHANFLAQAIASVDSMFIGRKLSLPPTIRQKRFSSKIQTYFNRQQFKYDKNPVFKGKDIKEHSFDFQLHLKASTEMLIKLLPDDEVQRKYALIYEWQDVRAVSVEESSILVALENSSSISEKNKEAINAMSKNNIAYVSNKDAERFFETLAG